MDLMIIWQSDYLFFVKTKTFDCEYMFHNSWGKILRPAGKRQNTQKIIMIMIIAMMIIMKMLMMLVVMMVIKVVMTMGWWWWRWQWCSGKSLPLAGKRAESQHRRCSISSHLLHQGDQHHHPHNHYDLHHRHDHHHYDQHHHYHHYI